MELHPIPPGLWCVPSALVCLTGQPWDAVIHPAINRHSGDVEILGTVAGVQFHVTLAVLRELGYGSRAYRGPNPHATVGTWARLSKEKYPGRALLIHVPEHVVVVRDGRVYDSWQPHGAAGEDHPWKNARARDVYLIE